MFCMVKKKRGRVVGGSGIRVRNIIDFRTGLCYSNWRIKVAADSVTRHLKNDAAAFSYHDTLCLIALITTLSASHQA